MIPNQGKCGHPLINQSSAWAAEYSKAANNQYRKERVGNEWN